MSAYSGVGSGLSGYRDERPLRLPALPGRQEPAGHGNEDGWRPTLGAVSAGRGSNAGHPALTDDRISSIA